MKEVNLPSGWKETTLESLIAFALGGDWGKDESFDDSEYVAVRCIRASEIKGWEEEKGQTAALRKIKKSSLEKRALTEGDILVEISGGGPEQPVGRTVLIDKAALSQHPGVEKVCTNFFRLIRPISSVFPKYLNYFLHGFYKSGKISDYQAGSNNLRNLKFKDYLTIPIPLPSIDEQKHIVAKIEALFSELDKGIESLKTAREQLKIYRQALLKHAFEGKLTEQWRKENADKLETPEQLLARIQQEREARYQQQLEEWKQSRGGRSKPKQPNQITSLADLKLASPRELPQGWAWIKIADIGRIETGTTPAKKEPKNYGGDTPFFKPTDLEQGANVLEAREHLTVIGREAARILPAGTTLVTCIGATIGKTGLATVECATNQQINSISPESCFDARFVYYALIGPSLNGLVKSEASSTTLPILNKSKFESLPFPICSLPEQRELARLLDSQFEIIEQNEWDIDADLKRSEALRQSILKKAFSGKLLGDSKKSEIIQ